MAAPTPARTLSRSCASPSPCGWSATGCCWSCSSRRARPAAAR